MSKYRYQVLDSKSEKIVSETNIKDWAECEVLEYGKYGSRSAFIKEKIFESDLKNEFEKLLRKEEK